MKVIFLDIDGVLNDFNTFERRREIFDATGKWELEIDEEMVKRLKKIVEATQGNVVLSSSWRSFFTVQTCEPWYDKGKELAAILGKHGIKLYGRTGGHQDTRAEEIDLWLSEHPDVENFVILDDESGDLIKYIDTKLVKTSFARNGEPVMDMSQCSGLQDRHVEQAIKILNGEAGK